MEAVRQDRKRALVRGAGAVVLAALAACSHVSPPPSLAHTTPGPAQATSGTPLYVGEPAASVRVETRILGISPDGYARWLAIAHFFDAHGKPTLILANSNLEWIPSTGVAQWQNRMRYGQPSAILSTDRDGPIALTVRATLPKLPTVVVRTDTRQWHVARVVAGAIGPHLVQVGWFPYTARTVRITRIGRHGTRTLPAVVSGGSTYRDPSVRPGATYRYEVARSGIGTILTGIVHVPRALPRTSIANASGSGMWLFFTTNPTDDIYYRKLDPAAIVRQAIAAHLHYVELRAAYGGYFEITSQVKPTVDAIVDGLESHGIGAIGWAVPREVTYGDLHATLEVAAYRTARGRHFTGLAIDAERGDEYMGDGASGYAAIGTYLGWVREAVGPRYLLVATVEDPFFEHLNAAKYPYRAVARAASVLQPMAYWRMMRRRPTNPAQVSSLLRDSYATLLRMAGRRVPISIGGQTSALSATGYPPPQEISASLRASKGAGAIGEAFFAWNDTLAQQWRAIGAFDWK